MSDPAALVARIVGFIRAIGLEVEEGPVGDGAFLPGVRLAAGRVIYDPERLAYPGDLLHEAAHLAVMPPARRAVAADRVEAPSADEAAGEEMMCLAWTYAAARQIGLEPAVVFHPNGYRGASAALIAAFEQGGMLGQPLLQYHGMTADRRLASELGAAPFPAMLRWVRER